MGVAPESLIRLESLAKTYSMGQQEVAAVAGVDLDVSAGEFVAIMGPSGSGKSTLMNIIGCLDVPSSGTYHLRGRDVSRLGETELARVRNREIGFVFQSFNLLPSSTAQRNVELPLVYSGVPSRERARRAAEALDAVKMADRAHHRPGELSGGECQRVAVARALVTRPSLLLADEPTGNLDSATSEELLGLFSELHGLGNTIILVTHEESIARRAGRVIHLRDGAIVSDQEN